MALEYQDQLVQGQVRCDTFGTGTTWAILYAGNGTHHTTPFAATFFSWDASDSDHRWRYINRGIYAADLSGLSSDLNITRAVLKVYCYDKSNELDISPNPQLRVYNASLADPPSLSNSDYQNCGTTPYSAFQTYNTFTALKYTIVELNSTAYTAIEAGLGTHWVCCIRSNYDVNNEEPTKVGDDPITVDQNLVGWTFTSVALGIEYTTTTSPATTVVPTTIQATTLPASGKWCGAEWDELSKIVGHTIGAGDLQTGADLS